MLLALAAEHEALAPPFKPAQLHIHGPAPETLDAVPDEQRPEVGALLKLLPLEGPQAPGKEIMPPRLKSVGKFAACASAASKGRQKNVKRKRLLKFIYKPRNLKFVLLRFC